MSDALSAPTVIPGLLSVVIPIGGVDRWLEPAVRSVLSQTGVEFEVIAVFNNGATVPEAWWPKDDTRVRTIVDPLPLGPGGAGQRGIDAAQGEFLVCLDADDVMLPGRMRTQLQWLTQHPECVLVSSQVGWIDADDTPVGAFELPTAADVRQSLLSLNVAPHSAWMARLSAVREAGGYDPTMHQMEDYDLLLRLAVRGTVAVLPETLTQYRLHPTQLSRAVRPNGHYVSTIARRRRALGKALGTPGWRVRAAQLKWEAQQWIMFVGRKVRG